MQALASFEKSGENVRRVARLAIILELELTGPRAIKRAPYPPFLAYPT